MFAAFLLIFLTIVYRLATAVFVHEGGSAWLANFAPMAAIALCSAIYLPRKYKFTLPFGALLVCDLFLNSFYGVSLFSRMVVGDYLAFAVVGLIGLAISRRPSLTVVLPASLGGSVVFYTITNALSWLTDPGYVKNFAGLLQALTVGLPQYGATPTWMFFRNSVVSDLLFTLLFVACMNFSRRPVAARVSPAPASRPLPN
jgi:hypothetical protein